MEMGHGAAWAAPRNLPALWPWAELSAKQKGEIHKFTGCFQPTILYGSRGGREWGERCGPALSNPGFSGLQNVESKIVHDGFDGGRISPQTPGPVGTLFCPLAK